MALTNYTELQAEIASWHHRDPGKIPDFIALAEARINSALASRFGETDVTIVSTPGSMFMSLPADFRSTRALRLITYGTALELIYLPPEQVPFDDSLAQPRYYTIEGAFIQFERPCDISHTFYFRYKKKYDIAATSTNDLLTNYPGVYLFGSLMMAAMHAVDKDLVEYWKAFYEEDLEKAQNSEFENKTQATLAMDGALASRKHNNILAGDM